MKVLLVNGSAKENGRCAAALRAIAEELNAAEIETGIFWPVRSTNGACTGCGACKGSGVCVYDRRSAEFVAAARDYDGFVFASPADLFGMSETMKSFMERAMRAGRKTPFAGKPALALTICGYGRGGAALDQMNRCLLRGRMLLCGTGEDGVLRAAGPEKLRTDPEAQRKLQALGRGMAWLMKLRAAGGAPPEQTESE